MLHLVIRKNIEKLLKKKNWNIVDLERQINRPKAIDNIFRGRSKNPSIEIIQSIATAFNVYIEELLIDHDLSHTIFNFVLFCDICNKVLYEFESAKHVKADNYDDIFSVIKEVYNYSMQLKLNQADGNYVKWAVQKLHKIPNSD